MTNTARLAASLILAVSGLFLTVGPDEAAPAPAPASAPAPLAAMWGAADVSLASDAEVACLSAAGARGLPGDGAEMVYGLVSALRSCGVLPHGWVAV